MAKNSTAARKSEGMVTKTRPAKKKRVVLFPLEPTSIDPRKIDAAIDAVIARRKNK